MITQRMVCKECGNDSFKFKWEYKDKDEEMRLLLCHDGWGFQLTDAKICCSKCNKWVEYESEDFITIKEKEVVKKK